MADNQGRSFLWVMDNLNIEHECKLPIETTLNFSNTVTIKFDKASYGEQLLIQNYIKNHVPLKSIHIITWKIVYEGDFVYRETGRIASDPIESGCSVEWRPIDQENWRYYVISYPQGEKLGYIDDLIITLDLLRVPITVGIDYTQLSETGNTYTACPYMSTHYQSLFRKEAQPIDCNALNEIFSSIPLILEKLLDMKERYSSIYRTIENYRNLLNIPKSSNMRTLGLFTIVEGLLTHKPGGPDTKDSLTHQIKKKIPLLNNRFDEKLPCSAFFPEIELEDKLWGVLYAYRSKMAHGDDIDFHSTEFRRLKDARNVHDFMHITVRTLLRNALFEPQLYIDLCAV